MKKHIVITGEGIVCAIGVDKQQVLQSLRQKQSGIAPIRYLHSSHSELPVAEVPMSNDEMRTLLGVSDLLISRTTLMGIMAIRQALADAGVSAEMVKEKALRLILVSGTTVAGMDITERFFHDFEHSDEALHSMEYHSAGSNTRLMADYFNIFTKYTTISTACSSAANALLFGARLLEAGECDMVVAGGSEALSIFHLNGFNSLMILDHEPCRPFDATRAGLNLGEGAAFLVMETEEHALQRKVEFHAYLTGYGNACDAFHQTASSDNGEGAYLAMTEALHEAGLQPTDIQYVNAHGTGTPNNDLSESVALQRVFAGKMPLVSSTKSFTGHTTSASGSIEAVICLLALTHQFVPANLNWSQPIEGGVVPTMGVDSYPLENILCNSFGFGGNDTSLVFSRLPHNTRATIATQTTDVHVLAEVEINSENELAEIRDYVKPLEARRMGKIMKSSLLSSLKALKQAGINQPDAIVTATSMGCLESSEQLLRQLIEEGETTLKPTFFMQSTHNTISSNVAIRLGCHGYNVTYTQDESSMEWALHDAELLLKSGKCKTVLVGCHDESTPLFRHVMERLGYPSVPVIKSKAIVLSCGE